ncbi:MAG: DUF4426 domain-containing protein [Gammaproteobacteria bacterium]
MLRIAVIVLALAGAGAHAEQSVSAGEFDIHYNALSTGVLDAGVAKAYGITRSRTRALLNVTVLKKDMGLAGQPVRAVVKATAANLSAQLRGIQMREIEERGAIYYIGEFPIADAETLRFQIEVTPQGAAAPTNIRFEQQFFAD